LSAHFDVEFLSFNFLEMRACGGDNMQMRARVTPPRQSAAMILMAAAMLLQGTVAIDK